MSFYAPCVSAPLLTHSWVPLVLEFRTSGNVVGGPSTFGHICPRITWESLTSTRLLREDVSRVDWRLRLAHHFQSNFLHWIHLQGGTIYNATPSSGLRFQ
jgi:hypothetical protein